MLLSSLRKILLVLFSGVFVISTGIFVICYNFGLDLPSEETLLKYTPPMTTKLYTNTNELMEEYAVEHRIVAKYADIPMIIKGAFIIAEDKEFYTHAGLSFASLLRAIVENTVKKNWTKRPAGGSTITQQIAKNLLVGNAKTLSRKIREAIMAFRIESMISKDRILEIYLNQLYLGKGCYGITEACMYYFNKPLDKIEPHEAAFLAAIPSAPTVYVNNSASTKLLTKRNAILYQMYDLGYITKEQLESSINKPIKINKKKHKLHAPYFSDEIFRILTQYISRDEFFSNGYFINTTLDTRIQNIAQKALEDGIISYTKLSPWRGAIGNINQDPKINLAQIDSQLPATINKIKSCVIIRKAKNHLICEIADHRKINISLSEKAYKNAKLHKGDVILCRDLGDEKYELYQTPKVTGGIVVMDARSGDVLALSGGYSTDISTFNCMTQALRQPGSTIKPFVYAAALEMGKDEYDIIEDKPVTITLKNGEKYTPHNYTGKAYGKTYLRDGVIYSRNLSTINLSLEIGMKEISNLLISMNLASKKPPISAVLGSIEVFPIQLLSAFSAFFNDGIMISSRFITEIKRQNDLPLGNIDREELTHHHTRKVLSAKTANTMKNILHDTVLFGTAKDLAPLEEKLHLKIYGKTGTTNNFKDAWFVGAVENVEKSLIVCVFIGFPHPRSLGKNQAGSKVALPIFSNFIQYLF